MLPNLREVFAALTAPLGASAQEVAHTVQLATAVMLVEVMRADGHFDPAERLAVIDILRAEFALSDDQTAPLVELAEQTVSGSTDWFEFTSHINAQFDMEAKVRIIEYMWRVAYADGHLSEHERHTMWRVSDLLHVPHGAYINAKIRAKAAASG